MRPEDIKEAFALFDPQNTGRIEPSVFQNFLNVRDSLEQRRPVIQFDYLFDLFLTPQETLIFSVRCGVSPYSQLRYICCNGIASQLCKTSTQRELASCG